MTRWSACLAGDCQASEIPVYGHTHTYTWIHTQMHVWIQKKREGGRRRAESFFFLARNRHFQLQTEVRRLCPGLCLGMLSCVGPSMTCRVLAFLRLLSVYNSPSFSVSLEEEIFDPFLSYTLHPKSTGNDSWMKSSCTMFIHLKTSVLKLDLESPRLWI